MSRRHQVSRRAAFRAGAAGSLILATSCGRKSGKSAGIVSQSSSATPQRGGTLGAFWNANPPALDPQFFATGATTSFACAIMSGLFRFKISPDPQVGLNHDLENELALSAESPDATTWTIKLRTDAKFHDVAPVNGHAVEAEDVKATFVRGVTSPQNPNRGVLGMVDANAIETPSTDTVVFKLRYPYAPFANLLGSVQYGLTFPREVLSGGFDPSKQVIGSGPFLFDGYTPDVDVTLKRNPGYFDKTLPYVDGVRHAILPATSLQLAQFAGGNLDSLVVAQNDVSTLAKAVPGARILKTLASGGGKAVYFQLGDLASPFQDIRLRRAVSLAIDRDAIAKTLYADESELSFSVQFLMGKWALRFNQLDPSLQQLLQVQPSRGKTARGAGRRVVAQSEVCVSRGWIHARLRHTSPDRLQHARGAPLEGDARPHRLQQGLHWWRKRLSLRQLPVRYPGLRRYQHLHRDGSVSLRLLPLQEHE